MVGMAATVEGERALATKEYGFLSKDLWTRIVARAKTWDVKRQPIIPCWTSIFTEKEEEHLHHGLGEKLYRYRFRSQS